MQPGAPIEARVLDVNKRDGIVDISLKAALVAEPKKAKGKGAGAAPAAPALDVGPASWWPSGWAVMTVPDPELSHM